MFDELLDEIMEAGIPFTVFKEDNVVYFDLNLEAKSYLRLSCSDKGWKAHMRYGEERDIPDMKELMNTAVHAMHGRAYISDRWKKLLEDHGYNLPNGK